MAVDQDTARGLLHGAYDMHVHSGPDLMPRKFDDIGLAERTRASGMAGFVLKSHYVCTADRASLIRSLYPDVKARAADEPADRGPEGSEHKMEERRQEAKDANCHADQAAQDSLPNTRWSHGRECRAW